MRKQSQHIGNQTNMIDFRKNVTKVGDKVATFVVEHNGIRMRTGLVVKIETAEHNVDYAEIQLETKIGNEVFHTYVQRNGGQFLRIE